MPNDVANAAWHVRRSWYVRSDMPSTAQAQTRWKGVRQTIQSGLESSRIMCANYNVLLSSLRYLHCPWEAPLCPYRLSTVQELRSVCSFVTTLRNTLADWATQCVAMPTRLDLNRVDLTVTSSLLTDSRRSKTIRTEQFLYQRITNILITQTSLYVEAVVIRQLNHRLQCTLVCSLFPVRTPTSWKVAYLGSSSFPWVRRSSVRARRTPGKKCQAHKHHHAWGQHERALRQRKPAL